MSFLRARSGIESVQYAHVCARLGEQGDISDDLDGPSVYANWNAGFIYPRRRRASLKIFELQFYLFQWSLHFGVGMIIRTSPTTKNP